MGVLVHRQELPGTVEHALDQRAIPGPGGHVGNRVVLAGQIAALGQQAVQHVELALDLHRIAVDRVGLLGGRVGIEVAEAAAEEGRAAHLPEQPAQRLRPLGTARRQEGAAELFRQIHQDRAGLEHPHRLGAAAVQQRRDLGVGVHRDEAAAELLAFVDADQPGVVLGAGVAEGQQLLQHHRDLDAIGRAQRVELQRVAADRQLTLVGGAGHWAVDVGKLAAAGLVPGPDWRRYVGIGHARGSERNRLHASVASMNPGTVRTSGR
mmetsp:Transcript_1028/g.2629  ORF Transcript_1028/g.2629 Transcript_1028/m.2629 type:complete len:265 (-) Transcript_1028:326-1120(-)